MNQRMWCSLVLVVAACSSDPSAPPLEQSHLDRAIDMMTRTTSRVVTDPNRALLSDQVESGLIAKNMAIVFCFVDYRKDHPGGAIDVIGAARVVPGGAASVAILIKSSENGRHVLDEKVTACARKELGARPFPTVTKEMMGDAEDALVGFRPLANDRER
jgi:hypothetical protein